MAVPYTFGSATTSIPLSQLDSNFATTITLGNTAIQLGNTVTTLNNMTMANVTVSSASTPVPEAAGGTGTTTGYYGFKNRIINGAMVINQRGFSGTVSGDPVYTLDRWYLTESQNSKFTISQNAGSVTPPVGFVNYLGATVASAVTVGASDYFALAQAIEGFNVADLNFGSANAKSVTISFWVYSSLTGTFGASLSNGAESRSYPFTYTVSSANTWTQITQTIAGDTTGTWATGNTAGMKLFFGLGCGSTYSKTAGSWQAGTAYSATGATSVVGTNGATFYITGVQLEKGSTATSFDYRPYGTELQLCQRYYWKHLVGAAYDTLCVGGAASTTTALVIDKFPVTMRASPTYAQVGSMRLYNGGGVAVTSSSLNNSNPENASVVPNVASGISQGQAVLFGGNNDTTAALTYSAEL